MLEIKNIVLTAKFVEHDSLFIKFATYGARHIPKGSDGLWHLRQLSILMIYKMFLLSNLILKEFLSRTDWVCFCGIPRGGAYVNFSSCQRNLIKNISDWRYDCTDYKYGFDFFLRLVKWPKISVKKKAKFFKNLMNKSRSILMLHEISKTRKSATKLIFFNEYFF